MAQSINPLLAWLMTQSQQPPQQQPMGPQLQPMQRPAGGMAMPAMTPPPGPLPPAAPPTQSTPSAAPGTSAPGQNPFGDPVQAFLKKFLNPNDPRSVGQKLGGAFGMNMYGGGSNAGGLGTASDYGIRSDGTYDPAALSGASSNAGGGSGGLWNWLSGLYGGS